MTEAHEDGNYLVRVRAQVMMRDDSTGGWVPMGGGGLSNVSVRKHAVPCDLGENKHEYLIYGKRISDQSVVFSCTIKKDFEYNKVMPTFHHWKTGDKKFGLTFQTAADARAFDKGVRTAVEELLDGLSECSPLHKYNADVGDDDVFMTLNLPVERGDSRSSSDSSTTRGGSRHATPPTEPHHLHRIHYVTRRTGGGPVSGTPTDRQSQTPGLPLEPSSPPPVTEPATKENYSYVQLTAVHEYIYPVVEERKHRDSSGSLKKRSPPDAGGGGAPASPPPPIPPPGAVSGKGRGTIGVTSGRRRRCRHCQEMYLEDHNPRGSCEYAPDCVRTSIERVACVSCAQCLVYHCAADAEGEFVRHPCDCGRDEGCGRRWVGLALLSLLVPCLWCYPPLRACHLCCVACGLCGGRHRPAS